MNADPGQPSQHKPALHVSDARAIPFSKSVVNVGRERFKGIAIADVYIFRKHLQLRKRFGVYALFDVNSRDGTRVNEERAAELQLRNGDVIAIGRTTLVYTDDNGQISGDGTTQILQAD